jgi:DNA-directed RNA polymerase specialized sigma24 family protein
MLDERCRQLLILLFYNSDRPTYTEIAVQLGIPEGGIGPTRNRCLQKLRDLLQETGI